MAKPLEVAKLAAAAAGEVLMKFAATGVTIQQKDKSQSYNLVSEADLQAEQAIGKIIKQHFPDHQILGEESHQGDTAAERLWVSTRWTAPTTLYTVSHNSQCPLPITKAVHQFAASFTIPHVTIGLKQNKVPAPKKTAIPFMSARNTRCKIP